ncbi:hypothetical protein [Allisonella histaminiformans]|uniref:hypothetical protein n=1 Tax=Allisonella histaminiformans TaxID=209880 RepID=UPI002942BBC9|nr:hypothetical protein [Allisonella histaminiformans]
MIDDDEGMNNAVEYYTNGDNKAYWDWFMKKMTDRWIELGKEEEEDEDYYDYDDEWEDFDWDEYDDYDVEWDEGDYDDE